MPLIGEFDEVDSEALQLCIDQTRADAGRREQLDSMLKDRSLAEVATFAAYHQQMRNLRLKPWEFPPCWVGDIDEALRIPPARDDHRKRDAAQLLQKMLDADISCYHPDPVTALAAAGKKETTDA